MSLSYWFLVAYNYKKMTYELVWNLNVHTHILILTRHTYKLFYKFSVKTLIVGIRVSLKRSTGLQRQFLYFFCWNLKKVKKKGIYVIKIKQDIIIKKS